METTLAQWKAEKKHTPLIIKGCRQCGKSFIVEKFGRENYEHVILLDFVKDSSYSAIFEGSLDVDHLTMLMSANMGTRASFVPDKTLIIFEMKSRSVQTRERRSNILPLTVGTMSLGPGRCSGFTDMVKRICPDPFRSAMNRSKKCILWISKNFCGQTG